MSKYDLSILIPSRNEEFLPNTIEDILKNSEANTEVIVVLDGKWMNLKSDPRVTVIYNSVSIGQREATNQACRLSQAKYVMKLDAHCAFDKGFDRKMIEAMQDNWTMLPVMKNLHVFDLVCKGCGERRYQGPTSHSVKDSEGITTKVPVKCPKCQGIEYEKDILWRPKSSPNSTSFCFDSEPHFQYFGTYRPKQQGSIVDTMSIQGSCFMLTREKYWELNICDDRTFGSWGSQGIEVACKTWLSGGRVVVNKDTWYAHMFRTQGGDFGFPYENKGSQVERAKLKAKELFFDNFWHKQIYPMSWLLEKFWPVEGWTKEQFEVLKKWPLRKAGIVYYTDNQLDKKIMKKCQEQIKASGLSIVSVSLNSPIDFGKNVVFKGERSFLTMFKQILTGLEAIDTEIVFLCESDVLYHLSHFEFRPPSTDKYYYNMNSWIVRLSDGFAVRYDHKAVSGLCADRQLLIKHYKERIRRVELEGFTRKMGFEPGTHNRAERVDNVKAVGWRSEHPNLDLKHGKNITQARWRQEDFRDKRNCQNWQETYQLPFWGRVKT